MYDFLVWPIFDPLPGAIVILITAAAWAAFIRIFVHHMWLQWLSFLLMFLQTRDLVSAFLFFLPPPTYFFPKRILLRCLALMLNIVQASFAMPDFMNFFLSLSHTAATKSQVGLFLTSQAWHATSDWGSNILVIFACCAYAVVVSLGSWTGLRYLSGTLIWTMGWATAHTTVTNMWGSVIFPNDDTHTATELVCVWASPKWSNNVMIICGSSSLCFFSGREWRNSHPPGTSVDGSLTPGAPVTNDCHKCKHDGSCMVLIATFTSASAICCQCLAANFLKFWTILNRASFLSSFNMLLNPSKTASTLSWYEVPLQDFAAWCPAILL